MCWAQGFIDSFDSLLNNLTTRYPDLDTSEITTGQLSSIFDQHAPLPDTQGVENLLLLLAPLLLIDQEAYPSLVIVEEDKEEAGSDPEGTGENTPDLPVSPHCQPEPMTLIEPDRVWEGASRPPS